MKRVARIVVCVALAAPAVVHQAWSQTRIGPAGAHGTVAGPDDCGGDVAGFVVRAGDWIDAIRVVCREADGGMRPLPSRGGTGGSPQAFLLQQGEQVQSITGAFLGPAGPFVYAIQFHTNRRSSPIFGNGGGGRGAQVFELDVPAGQWLNGIEAVTSQFLNGLTLLVRPSPAGTNLKDPGTAASCPVRGGICTDPGTGLVWQSVLTGGAVPAQALEMVSHSQRLCRAYVGDPGVAEPVLGSLDLNTRAGCAFALNGQALLAGEYEVLIGLPPNAPGEFTERDGLRIIQSRNAEPGVPALAITAAVFRGEPQAICFASVGDGGHGFYGWLSASSGGCMVVNGGYAMPLQGYMVIGQVPPGR